MRSSFPRAKCISARANAGFPSSVIYHLGHPVHPKFEDVTETKQQIRKTLGLPAEEDDRAADGRRGRRRQIITDHARTCEVEVAAAPRRRYRSQYVAADAT